MADNEKFALTEAVYYILLSMYKPIHGYGVMQDVARMSGGRLSLGAGTLYGALNTLIERNWIKGLEMDADSRKKEYIITQSGKDAIEAEIRRLGELLENGRKVTGIKA